MSPRLACTVWDATAGSSGEGVVVVRSRSLGSFRSLPVVKSRFWFNVCGRARSSLRDDRHEPPGNGGA